MINNISREGFLFILSSSSGTGKTTLARKLLASEQTDSGSKNSSLCMSVSCTTRPQLDGEVDGEDYHFIDEATFHERKQRGEFLEWAKVFDNFYATPHEPVRLALAKGSDVLFDVDWQGAQQITAQMEPTLVVRVFLLPPSRSVLEQRLIARRRDDASALDLRLARVAEEIAHYKEYDYVIFNDDLELAFASLRSILQAERYKRRRQNGLEEFVASFVTETSSESLPDL